jgi:hypothetical protein
VHDSAIRFSNVSPPQPSRSARIGRMKNPRVRVEPARDRSTHGSKPLDQPWRDPGRSARVRRRIGRPIIHPSIVVATRHHLPGQDGEVPRVQPSRMNKANWSDEQD